MDNTEGKNYKSFMNSHLCKNSEWGAIVYLTQSKYGLNTNKTVNGENGAYRGGGENKAYINYANRSTTNNVYGIYDMNKGFERTAIFNSINSGSTYTYNWTENTNINSNSNSTKYATKYYNTIKSHLYKNKVIYEYGKIGDATKEVSKGGKFAAYYDEGDGNWINEYHFLPFQDRTYSVRGLPYDFSQNWLLSVVAPCMSGMAKQGISIRTVLCQ